MPIRILIADDHALLRQGIRNFLSLESDFEIVGEAAELASPREDVRPKRLRRVRPRVDARHPDDGDCLT